LFLIGAALGMMGTSVHYELKGNRREQRIHVDSGIIRRYAAELYKTNKLLADEKKAREEERLKLQQELASYSHDDVYSDATGFQLA